MSKYIQIKQEVKGESHYEVEFGDCEPRVNIAASVGMDRYLDRFINDDAWEMSVESLFGGKTIVWTFTPVESKTKNPHHHEIKVGPQKNYGLDPNGIGQHELGAKLDKGKPMAGRLLGMFGNALYAVSEVGTFGANKYTEGGWQHVSDGFKRYDDAGMRHILKRGMGEDVDPESGMTHLAHEAWNALAKLELYLREEKKDLNQ